MKENLCILQFDDDDNYFAVTEIIFFNMGLEMTARAQTIAETRDLISKIEAKKLKPDIAIVANYLGNNFEDGRKLSKKLKEIVPEVKIIAYVVDSETEWGDYIAIKSGTDAKNSLITILSELTGKQFTSSNIKDSEHH